MEIKDAEFIYERHVMKNSQVCVKCGHNIGVDAEGLCNQRLHHLGDVQPNLCLCKCEFPEASQDSIGVPEQAFRNSVGFQINFILYSGLEVEKAIDHICQAAERLVAARTALAKHEEGEHEEL